MSKEYTSVYRLDSSGTQPPVATRDSFPGDKAVAT